MTFRLFLNTNSLYAAAFSRGFSFLPPIAECPFSVYTVPMLTKEEKQKQIEAGRMHTSDTGSSAVQVSVLSHRIEQMNNHLKNNHKDKHSRRGLVALVERRRKHLSYLREKNSELYETVVERLGLRK